MHFELEAKRRVAEEPEGNTSQRVHQLQRSSSLKEHRLACIELQSNRRPRWRPRYEERWRKDLGWALRQLNIHQETRPRPVRSSGLHIAQPVAAPQEDMPLEKRRARNWSLLRELPDVVLLAT